MLSDVQLATCAMYTLNFPVEVSTPETLGASWWRTYKLYSVCNVITDLITCDAIARNMNYILIIMSY